MSGIGTFWYSINLILHDTDMSYFRFYMLWLVLAVRCLYHIFFLSFMFLQCVNLFVHLAAYGTCAIILVFLALANVYNMYSRCCIASTTNVCLCNGVSYAILSLL